MFYIYKHCLFDIVYSDMKIIYLKSTKVLKTLQNYSSLVINLSNSASMIFIFLNRSII